MSDERRKDFHAKEYQKGLEAIAEEVTAQEAVARQARLRQMANVAGETIDLAEQLKASGNPYKQKLAEDLMRAASGAIRETESGQLPAEGGWPVEAHPFASDSSSLGTSSLSSSPKALPNEAEESPKRGPGRPRKHPKD